MTQRRQSAPHRRLASSGFTLIELMVAITISIFLLAGMVILLQNVRSTYNTENSLATLEDNERLTMMLMTNVIQSAGYFPQPMINTAASSMPASTNFPNDQGSPAMLGGTNAQGATIVVRFAADSTTPALMNCMGQSETGAAIDWENSFYIDPSGNLDCQVTDGLTNVASPPVTIATGLTTNTNATTNPAGMTIFYGVSTGTAVAPTCMDTYKSAAQMSSTDWANVCAVKVTLTFLNPVPPPDGSDPTISFTRVIAVMNMVGAST
jgi:type IV pilus assembly protein PilW